MNKRKKVAIMKHRHKKKRAELRKKAVLIAAGSIIKPAVKVTPQKEKEMPKGVKALADMLKPKEPSPVKKTVSKKEKPAPEKTAEATKKVGAEKIEKPKKPVVRKKKTETEETTASQTGEPKKAPARKKKTETSGG